MDNLKERSQRTRAFRMAAKRMKRRSQTCAARGCGRTIERWMRFCPTCFDRLPVDHKRAIASATAEGRLLDRAVAVGVAVKWLAEHSPAALTARQLGEAPP